jgi:hypothetical protein
LGSPFALGEVKLGLEIDPGNRKTPPSTREDEKEEL